MSFHFKKSGVSASAIIKHLFIVQFNNMYSIYMYIVFYDVLRIYIGEIYLYMFRKKEREKKVKLLQQKEREREGMQVGF